MRKIGVYGGSFSPLHNGHIHAAREAYTQLALDEILLIPAGIPPHKQLPAETPDAAVRLEMIQTAVRALPYIRVSDTELRREGKNFTADTLAELHAQMPEDRLYLLMGTDMFLSFETWHCPEQIAGLAELVLMPREKADNPVEIAAQKEKLERLYGARIHILSGDALELSSSDVRRMAAFRCLNGLIPPEEERFIFERGLYRTGEDWTALPFEELKTVSLSLHKEKRVPHVLGCCRTAVRLAERYGADPALAARAGILHDVTKALDGTNQLRLCEKYAIITEPFEREHDKLLHAKTGSAVAQFVFGECETVSDAIYWHTTGRPNMTLMEKIVYLADYIEPCRAFDGVEEIRTLAELDLDRALLAGFEMSIDELVREGKPVGKTSLAARDSLRKELKNT